MNDTTFAAAPTNPTQQKTQSAYLTLSLITQACQGILNTVFIAPSPKPSWFDALNASLDAAKVVAKNWIDNIAPGITSGVPVQVINYGTTYAAIVSKIDAIATTYPTASGADDPHVKEVRALVAALQGEVQVVIASCKSMDESMKSWGDDMQKAHDTLTTGAANIQKAETDLATDITKMNAAIQQLNETIHKENIGIAASAGAIGLGLLLTVAGIALAPETGGASLLVAGTGALLIIGGAVTWGVMQSKINQQYDEIGKDQSRLSDDKRQLVALQGLATSSSQAVMYTSSATSYLSEFRTSWNLFLGELQGVLHKLDSAQTELKVIVADAFADAAQKEWADATAFAQSLANAPVSVATADFKMNGDQIPAQPQRAA